MRELKLEVPAALFAPAAHGHFEGTYDLAAPASNPNASSVAEPVSWSVDLTNTGDAILVTGSVEGVVATPCARCLEEARVPIVGEIEGYFLIGSAAAAPEGADDEFDVLPDDNMIDLASLIGAAVLLEAPLMPLCDEGCKGLCPTCGANLNEGACACSPPSGDGAAANPFAALAGYSFE